MAREYTTLEIAGQELKLSSPSRVYFPAHEAPAISNARRAAAGPDR